MSDLTLLRQGNPLSDPFQQLAVLHSRCGERRFHSVVADHVSLPLRSESIGVLQVNVGKVCNQTCRHCHVDAGPTRRETMDRETMVACLSLLERSDIGVLDITGGAPEMNPSFRWFVENARRIGRHVIDRCNLTILQAPGFEDLADFLADQRVEIIASLPCYLAENTDAQRGHGVFEKSISALRKLNDVGYGQPDSGRILNLVYNPLGPTLPPQQESLEADYRRELFERYKVSFNRIYTITNMPISRFLDDLVTHGQLEKYMELLIANFNPASIPGLMCRDTLSVGWDGSLYDCDFNQMLELRLAHADARNIRDVVAQDLVGRAIVTGQHCFGCTAGAGSSCRGAIAPGL
jgi:radical SAM/Cys-rich protein